MLKKALHWVLLRDYAEAKKEVMSDCLHADLMDEAALQKLSREGDKALRCLQANIPKRMKAKSGICCGRL